MIGYDLLIKFRELTPYQQDLCIQWFMGGISMSIEGFIDCKNRPEYPHAIYTAKEFEKSLHYANLQPKQMIEVTTMSNKLDQSYNRYCLVCGFNKLHHSSSEEFCTQCSRDKGDAECIRIVNCKKGTKRSMRVDGLVKLVDFPLQEKVEMKTEMLSDRVETEEEKRAGDFIVPETVEFAGGKVTSSKCPAFHLIPSIALLRLVKRFELGQERKGNKAWNATTDQSVLDDRAWVMERLNHVIKHAMDLRDKLAKGDMEAVKNEDDSAAIMWAGAFLICATEKLTSSSSQKADN